MHPTLSAALAPVLADLSNTCRVTLRVQEEEWSLALGPSAMVWTPDGTGTGISIVLEDSVIDQVVSITDQVQEVVIEGLWLAGLPVTWPQCPDHPDTHPLEPTGLSDSAVWRCPASGSVIAELGKLEAV